jgi:hypothetical protein
VLRMSLPSTAGFPWQMGPSVVRGDLSMGGFVAPVAVVGRELEERLGGDDAVVTVVGTDVVVVACDVAVVVTALLVALEEPRVPIPDSTAGFVPLLLSLV